MVKRDVGRCARRAHPFSGLLIWNFGAFWLIGRVNRITGKVKLRFLLNFAFEALTHVPSSEETPVRKLSKATTIIVVAIALYFALIWGFDGLRILSSPTYGLDDGWRSQFVFSIGHLFNLGPIGLIKLAAFFGGLKLAVACIFAFHIVDRLRSLSRGRTNTEILEAGLILVVAISIASVGPGSLTDSADLMREHTLPLLFAALATGLCILERNKARREEETEIESANLVDQKTAQAAPRFHP